MLSNLPLSLVNYSNLAVSPSPLSSLPSSPLSSPSSSSCKLGSYLLLLIMAALLLPRATGHPLPDASRKTGFDQSDGFHIDFPQGDEAPRPGGVTHSLPKDWRLQPQERYYYLRAMNDQYLQIKNDSITGTYSNGKPSKYGILQFISHNNSLLISSADSHQLICMNKESQLYLVHRKEFNDNKECYIHESNNDAEGSASATYEFTLYRTPHRHLYLGIDCQALLGSETNSTEKTTRFITEPANKALIRHPPEPEDNTTHKCIPQKEIDRKLRLKKEKKFKAKVCRNLIRLAKNVTESLTRCRLKCAQTKNCMCPILERMLASPNDTQVDCLASKIKKWVVKRGKTPNMRVIKRVARRLLPGYSRIARRMRSEWKKKHSPQTATNKQINKQINKPTSKPRGVIKINKLLRNHTAELSADKPDKLKDDFIKGIKKLLDTKSKRRQRQRKRKVHKRRRHNKNRSRRREQRLAQKELPARLERDARHPQLSAPPG
ncbi:uncharacterized protein LOC131938277 [Physella acuta]|uniref:uncharacterized protein LOC131938277 n=1 Tax=Physella acuta TaxID=109671 RepID=UPI0027DDF714|nr:uncharacterized protein LOC131938277 [Physella acuta]